MFRYHIIYNFVYDDFFRETEFISDSENEDVVREEFYNEMSDGCRIFSIDRIED